MNNCAQEYSCPDPTIAIDPFVTTGNRFVDISAGGPTPFTFSTTSNASWVNIESGEGSISPSSPEQRVFLSVDWSKVSGAEAALLRFTAKPENQTTMSVTVTLVANNTQVPSGFSGAWGRGADGRVARRLTRAGDRVRGRRWDGIDRGGARCEEHERPGHRVDRNSGPGADAFRRDPLAPRRQRAQLHGGEWPEHVRLPTVSAFQGGERGRSLTAGGPQ